MPAFTAARSVLLAASLAVAGPAAAQSPPPVDVPTGPPLQRPQAIPDSPNPREVPVRPAHPAMPAPSNLPPPPLYVPPNMVPGPLLLQQPGVPPGSTAPVPMPSPSGR